MLLFFKARILGWNPTPSTTTCFESEAELSCDVKKAHLIEKNGSPTLRDVWIYLQPIFLGGGGVAWADCKLDYTPTS